MGWIWPVEYGLLTPAVGIIKYALIIDDLDFVLHQFKLNVGFPTTEVRLLSLLYVAAVLCITSTDAENPIIVS